MSVPASPSPSSASDDFAALLDAELQKEVSEEVSGDEVVVDEDIEEDDEAVGKESAEPTDYVEVDGDDEEEEKEGSSINIDNDNDDDDDDDDDEDDDVEMECRIDNLLSSEVQARKRKREEDEAQSPNKALKGQCPPHPGFMWGVCIRCGLQKQADEPDEAGVALRYIHEGLEVTEREAARMRHDELKHVVARRKLYLVLDLDHTLLNSARFVEVSSEEEAYLARNYSGGRPTTESTSDAGGAPQVELGHTFRSGLYRLDHLQMWTKLRPFVHEFLEVSSKLFEMYVYTMGERTYALAMARLLDPTGRFFGDRVISQGDSTCRTTKDLDVVLGAESAVVILDDTEGVWPKHRANLILMERYHFFSSSCRQFGLKSLSLTEKMRDESEKDGTLATTLNTLRGLHGAVFSAAAPKNQSSAGGIPDVREEIQTLRGTILEGCRIIFSRIFPSGLTYPETHPFWRLTEELGAYCSTSWDDSITHVVALDRGTDKAHWAKQEGRFLVHPSWVEASQYLWARAREEDFPVGENNPEPPLTSFAKTVQVDSDTSRGNDKPELQTRGTSTEN